MVPSMAATTDTEYKAIKIYDGVSIYKVRGSQFYYVRIWDSKTRRQIVKSTRETSKIAASKVAKEYALSIPRTESKVEREFTFKHFATKLLAKDAALATKGKLNVGYVKSIQWSLDNKDWGLIKWFGSTDVRKITTRDFRDHVSHVSKLRPDLSSSSKNTIMASFRSVLKIAREEGVIDMIPDTPRSEQRDNPRPFFRFYPLVDEAHDDYKKLLATAKAMAHDDLKIRGIAITEELYDLVLFTAHSFVRPTVSELYALKHNDVTIAEDPRRLILIIRNGKTGYRAANTMPGAVAPYKRCCARNPNATGEDYIFLPTYPNRKTASQIMQRQFNALLKKAGIKNDLISGKKHSMYSLRHTAICMRLVLSEGQVNIYNLAKNAGTSVDQIERFYAKHLPQSAAMVTICDRPSIPRYKI
jgi:hypothetical protein